MLVLYLLVHIQTYRFDFPHYPSFYLIRKPLVAKNKFDFNEILHYKLLRLCQKRTLFEKRNDHGTVETVYLWRIPVAIYRAVDEQFQLVFLIQGRWQSGDVPTSGGCFTRLQLFSKDQWKTLVQSIADGMQQLPLGHEKRPI